MIACLIAIFFCIRNRHTQNRFALRKSHSAPEASSSDVVLKSSADYYYDEANDLPTQGHPSRLGRARKAADDKRPETIKRKMTESLVDFSRPDVTPEGSSGVQAAQCGGSAAKDKASGEDTACKRLFEEEL